MAPKLPPCITLRLMALPLASSRLEAYLQKVKTIITNRSFTLQVEELLHPAPREVLSACHALHHAAWFPRPAHWSVVERDSAHIYWCAHFWNCFFISPRIWAPSYLSTLTGAVRTVNGISLFLCLNLYQPSYKHPHRSSEDCGWNQSISMPAISIPRQALIDDRQFLET